MASNGQKEFKLGRYPVRAAGVVFVMGVRYGSSVTRCFVTPAIGASARALTLDR